MPDTRKIAFKINYLEKSAEVETRLTLADFLRHELLLTGTHVGCEHGVCGACTILYNGDSARACLMLACQADGASIETVESLGTPDNLGPLQEAFRAHHALQQDGLAAQRSLNTTARCRSCCWEIARRLAVCAGKRIRLVHTSKM